jgi:hypothetical protein
MSGASIGLYIERAGKRYSMLLPAPQRDVRRFCTLSGLALVEGRIDTLRAAGSNKADLTQRQAHALAAEWYRWFTAQHLDNPGHPERWARLQEILLYLLDLDEDDTLSRLAVEARADQFLTDRSLALTQAGREAFLVAVSREFAEAAETLQRRARGDWGPDRHEAELASAAQLSRLFPPSQPPAARSTGSAVTCVELFRAYCLDKKPKASTGSRWRCVFPALDGWLQAEGLTSTTLDSDAAQRWVDTLVTEGRTAKTVKDTWVAAPRAVFAWAKRKRKLNGQANPFQGLTVEKTRQTITRETGKEFTEAEALTFLQAALFVAVSPSSSFSTAKRWVPCTGARVGEITQLRVQDIEERACGPVLCITPEAGTVKNDRARAVPIHPIWSRRACWPTSRPARRSWPSALGSWLPGMAEQRSRVPYPSRRPRSSPRGCANSGSPT